MLTARRRWRRAHQIAKEIRESMPLAMKMVRLATLAAMAGQRSTSEAVLFMLRNTVDTRLRQAVWHACVRAEKDMSHAQ